jgi:hypothetical protein
MMSTTEPPQPVFCVVEFVPGSRVHKERPHVPGLAVVQNGPPGTFVTFVDGRSVPLPTDQIVLAQDEGGAARVGFGGMRFEGIHKGVVCRNSIAPLDGNSTPLHAASR